MRNIFEEFVRLLLLGVVAVLNIGYGLYVTDMPLRDSLAGWRQ